MGYVLCQVPLSVGFSRQEYWNGLPFPTSGDLPDPGIKLLLLSLQHLQADSYHCTTWEATFITGVSAQHSER